MSLFTCSLRALFIVTLILNSQFVLATINVENIMPASGGSICDGSFRVIANGSAKPFIIDIVGPTNFYKEGVETEINFSDLCPGQYQVEVTDRFGCKWTFTPTVGVSCAVQLKEVIEPVCNTATGNNGGKITVTPTSGTAPYNYEWKNAQGNVVGMNQNFLPVTAGGTYSVSVTDASGCGNVKSFTVPGAPFAIANYSGPSKYPCKDTPGELRVYLHFPSYNPPYSFVWSNSSENAGMTDYNIINSGLLDPGNYSVTITDNNGCQTIEEFTLPENEIIAYIDVDETCNAQISVAAGNTNSAIISKYTYKWNNGATSPTISNLDAGIYCATITEEATGCKKEIFCIPIDPGTLKIKVDEVLQPIYEDNEPPKNNGSITISSKGGVAPVTFLWNTGSTSNHLSNLLPGTYTVTATDANGCTAIETIEIDQCPPGSGPLKVTLEDVNPYNKTMTIYIEQGRWPYTIEVFGPNDYYFKNEGVISIYLDRVRSRIGSLNQEGNYCIKVTDRCGRNVTKCHYMIGQCPAVEFDFDVNNRCLNGGIFNGEIFRETPSVQYLDISGGLLFAYGNIVNEVINSGGELRFVLDWHDDPEIDGNLFGHHDGTMLYDPDGSFDFLGDQKFNNRKNNDVTVTIRDFLGCVYTETHDFGKPTQKDEFFPEKLEMYIPDYFGTDLEAFTKTISITRCGDEEQSRHIKELEYKPNDYLDPCKGGGTIYSEKGTFTVPRNTSTAEEYPNYDKLTGRDASDGLCLYACGCYFPPGTILNSQGAIEDAFTTMPVYIIETEKKAACPPDFDDECPRGIAEIVATGENCLYNEICTEDGRNPRVFQHKILSDCYRITENGGCKVYQYCSDNLEISNPIEFDNVEDCRSITSLVCDPNAVEVPGIQGEEIPNSLLKIGENLTELGLESKKTTKIQMPVADKFKDIKIYPNPFKDMLNIEYNSQEEGTVTIQLLNTIGIHTLSQQFQAVKGMNKFSIETKSNVSLGVYYLKITDQNGNFSIHKVVH